MVGNEIKALVSVVVEDVEPVCDAGADAVVLDLYARAAHVLAGAEKV